jgi:hypothetical protein
MAVRVRFVGHGYITALYAVFVLTLLWSASVAGGRWA